ncbi:unnamed protein product [Pleuronectes platessa]|uniref:Peroxiredoxin-like 2 activated in M-CSF stimulated monocytes n=1 Tax=Pleuronectes platessa TaxID=8262 RepID=A0A9N7V6N6_PLEPL|nr:unnamed protein product [Pleuronectes platessa]
MLALSRCSPSVRRSVSMHLSLGSLTLSRLSSATARPHILRTHSAPFHQSRAKSSPEPNKPTPVFSSGLEGDLLEMGMWSLGLGAVGAALAGIFLANTDLCLPKAAMASLEHLEDADLHSTVDDATVIKAKSLWEQSGAVVMVVRRPGMIFVQRGGL